VNIALDSAADRLDLPRGRVVAMSSLLGLGLGSLLGLGLTGLCAFGGLGAVFGLADRLGCFPRPGFWEEGTLFLDPGGRPRFLGLLGRMGESSRLVGFGEALPRDLCLVLALLVRVDFGFEDLLDGLDAVPAVFVGLGSGFRRGEGGSVDVSGTGEVTVDRVVWDHAERRV